MKQRSRIHARAASYVSELLIVSVLLLAAVLYVPSLRYPFVWDDEAQIVSNEVLRDPKNILVLLTSGTFDVGGGVLAGAYFRPLVALSNFTNYQLWGINQLGFHLYQLLFHVINVYLVYLVVSRLLKKMRAPHSEFIAILSSLLFSVQPANVEAVVYIGSIGEVLYTFFLLVAFLVLLRIPDEKKRVSARSARMLALFFLLVLMGLLAKESAVVMIPIAAAYTLLFGKTARKFWLLFGAGTIATLLIYLWLRLFVAHIPFIVDYGSYISQAPLAQRMLTLPYILMRYFSILLFPKTLAIYQNAVISQVLDIRFWGNAALLVLVCIIIGYLIKHFRSRFLVFFLLWFAIGILPVLNIYGIDMTVTERWLYFPSIGFWGFLITLLFAALKNKPAYAMSAVIYIVLLASPFFAWRTLSREYDWRSAITLYGHDIQYVRNSFELLNNYAVELMKVHRHDQARGLLERSVALNPKWFISQTNLGVVYQSLGLNREAEERYLKIIATDGNPFAYANLIVLYINTGEYDAARTVLADSMRLFPTFNRLDFLAVLLEYKTGNKEKALTLMRELLSRPVVDRDIEEFNRQIDLHLR